MTVLCYIQPLKKGIFVSCDIHFETIPSCQASSKFINVNEEL